MSVFPPESFNSLKPSQLSPLAYKPTSQLSLLRKFINKIKILLQRFFAKFLRVHVSFVQEPCKRFDGSVHKSKWFNVFFTKFINRGT